MNAFQKIGMLSRACFGNPAKINYSRSKLRDLWARQSIPEDEFYERMVGQRQFTMYGDTNHSDTRIHQFFFSGKNAQNLIRGGVKHVFLERPPEQQEFLDQLARGEITPAEFAEKTTKFDTPYKKKSRQSERGRQLLQSIADFSHTMLENGVQVYCIDEQAGITEEDMKKLSDFMSRMMEYVEQYSDGPAIVHSQAMTSFIIRNLKYIAKQNILQDLGKILLTRADDAKLAAQIRNIAGNDNCAILFGAAHGGGSDNDLDDLLGLDKVVRIDIHGQQELYADKKPHKTIPPDYVHTLDNATVYDMGAER